MFFSMNFGLNIVGYGGVFFLHPFDFEEPEEGFSRATRDLDRFSRARSRLGDHFPHCREESFYQCGFEVEVFRGMLCRSLAE